MKYSMSRWMAVAVLAVAATTPVGFAEETTKALPTLLIKGEVVSVDTNDPTVTLIKVKDRYGFETPIYVTSDAKIAKGDQMLTAANLAAGTPVEVEYNFDINTARRHAATIKVTTPTATASSPAAQASPASPEPAAAAPETPAPITPAPTAPATASPTDEQPADETQ